MTRAQIVTWLVEKARHASRLARDYKKQYYVPMMLGKDQEVWLGYWLRFAVEKNRYMAAARFIKEGK